MSCLDLAQTLWNAKLLLDSNTYGLNVCVPQGFKATIDQMAETGFEMLVFSFGSGFKLESADPLCLLGATSLSASSEAILETRPI